MSEEQEQPIKTFDELFLEMPIVKPSEAKFPPIKKSSDKLLTLKQLLAMHTAVRPARTTIEILEHAAVYDGYLVSTDLEHCIRTKLSAIPDARFTELSDGVYTIASENVMLDKKFELNDFPQLNIKDWERVGSCTFKFDRQLFSSTLPIVCKDELRGILLYVQFDVAEELDALTIRATDGHMFVQHSFECSATGQFSFCLHRDLVEILLKDPSLNKMTVTVVRNCTREAKGKNDEPDYEYFTVIEPEHGLYTIWSKNECLSHNRTYPNTQRVLPEEITKTLRFNKQELYSALQALIKLMPKCVAGARIASLENQFWIAREEFDEAAARIQLSGICERETFVPSYPVGDPIWLCMPARFGTDNADVINMQVHAAFDPKYLSAVLANLPVESESVYMGISLIQNGAASGAVLLSPNPLKEHSPFA